MMWRFGWMMVCGLMLTGCATTVSFTPQHFRMDRPEVDARPLRPNIGLGQVNQREVPLQNEVVLKERESDLLGRIGLSLGHGIEFGVAAAGQATRYSLKYQFAGQYAEFSDVGNWSQAISLATERFDSDESTYCAFCSDGESDLWRAKLALYDLAWIIGYRPRAGWLVYGGPYYRFGEARGLWQGYPEAPTLSQKMEADGQIWGTNLATEYRFQAGLGFTLELVYANTRFDGHLPHQSTQNHSETFLNMVVDFRY
ncbi:hypothetical protein [Ferrimonas balearica]|uniref:hypothetical protein n=2 Tax=Ferrimonas balearica TaxID=44012 RepID=UPI001C953488|nr:hypothetical protein [Ferrimonas balearica]MBY6105167.1 hypothetical protein [Ferrimonas balearica]MBY6225017.1 hypothetical protein [Ferrimonas balearica]